MLYIGNNGHGSYKTTTFQAIQIFILHEEVGVTRFYEICTVSVISFADLKKEYPNLIHNAQENIINELRQLIYQNSNSKWSLNNTVRGYIKSLNDFDITIFQIIII